MRTTPPARGRRRLAPLPLDLLGVAELQEYIDELRTEIARVEAEIGRKTSHRSAADAFFRKPRLTAAGQKRGPRCRGPLCLRA